MSDFEPVEVSLLVGAHRVQFQRDGAGVVVTILAASGEPLDWGRLSSTECTWLAAVIR